LENWLNNKANRRRRFKKDEESPLKCMKTSNLQHILPAKETLSEGLCDADHNGE